MNLNHINLVVSNVGESINFFETYFGFKCFEVKGDNIIAILKNEANFILVLMKSKTDEIVYPAGFHIGFFQKDNASVNEIYTHLTNGGIDVGKEPGVIRDSFGFYFMYDHCMIEVSQNDG